MVVADVLDLGDDLVVELGFDWLGEWDDLPRLEDPRLLDIMYESIVLPLKRESKYAPWPK